jgi:hypothetical protein
MNRILSYCLLFFLCPIIALPLTAQEDENEIRTLFGNKSNGGYGAVSIGFTEINQIQAITIGGRGEWIIGHSLGLGFYGSGFMSDFVKSSTDLSYNLVGGHGGIILEPIFLPRFPVHLSFPLKAGFGGIAYAESQQPGFTGNYDGYVKSTDYFLIAEPGVELEFNLTRWLRLAIGASYTVTSDVHFKNTLDPIANDALKGISGGITIKFGRF